MAGSSMRNIRLVLAYDGTDFSGWQRQPSAPTIQGCVESTVEKVIGERVTVWGSGRTDAGVHALNQVANFKTASQIPCANLAKALNDALPPSIRVKEARETSEKFHARYDARSKTYRYRIYRGPICPPFIWRFVWHYPASIDRDRIAGAAQLIEGEHDFTSFAASPEECRKARPVERGRNEAGAARLAVEDASPTDFRTSPPEGSSARSCSGVRTIFSSRMFWRPRTTMLVYEIRGSGFLHHMVRNLVGTLVEVGKGKLEPSDVARIMEARDRTFAGPTAPAKGLCLVKVEY